MQESSENRTKVVLALMNEIERTSRGLKMPTISSDEQALGLRISENAARHPEEVPMSPLAKNGLRWAGDLKEGERLLAGAPITNFERWLTDVCSLFLLKLSGTKTEEYDIHKPILDPSHYWTDCWLNLDLEKWRDIKPGQVEEINKMIVDNYVRPTKDIGLRGLLARDPLFQRAVGVVMSELPVVVATTQIREVNLPFMTKHTNVGYPFFANDRTKVPHSNDTYATLTMRMAEELRNKVPEVVQQYRVYTEFARYQRGKGRLIIATPRVLNLILNQLESEEIATYKARCSLFAGYNDDVKLRQVMEEMTDFSLKNGYVMYNVDYHRYDAHIMAEWNMLAGAMSILRCGGGRHSRSGELAFWRAVASLEAYLVAGTLKRIVKIYGRKFSGELDTNRGGGVINATHMLYQLLCQDEHYLRDIVNKVKYFILVMGDDILFICKPNFDLKLLSNRAKNQFNFEIDDPTKNAYGPKFLQYRLFEYNGRRVFVYPFPRVLRSMLFKERPSTLGYAGWTLAFYQQLAKLVDFPEVLAFNVNIAAYLDDKHLSLDVPVSELVKQCQQEDREREQKLGSRAVPTAERLNDGDPTKSRQFSEDGSLNCEYFQDLQAKLRQVYDPSYLTRNSFPTLNKH